MRKFYFVIILVTCHLQLYSQSDTVQGDKKNETLLMSNTWELIYQHESDSVLIFQKYLHEKERVNHHEIWDFGKPDTFSLKKTTINYNHQKYLSGDTIQNSALSTSLSFWKWGQPYNLLEITKNGSLTKYAIITINNNFIVLIKNFDLYEGNTR